MNGRMVSLREHWTVLTHAWQRRREMESERRSSHELEFLPAALEVQESPPSPLSRAIVKAIALFFILAVGWSVLGEMDIVAVSQGKIIPAGKSKTIQPSETGVVRAIYIKDGQRVEAGDILVELDPTVADADKERAREEWLTARARLARVNAITKALGQGTVKTPALTTTSDVPERIWSSQRTLMQTQVAEYLAKIDGLRAEIERKRAERAAVEQEINKAEALIPIVSERAESMRRLVGEGLYPENDYLAVEQQRIEHVQNAKVLRKRLQETAAAIEQATIQRQAVAAEFRKNLLSERADLEMQAVALGKEVTKTAARSGLQRLTSPVAGVVQQLAVHTIGGVVTPAQPLMVVVPENETLEVEAWLENKDVGFVREGQNATIKIDAFPFTKYGTISGAITQLSRDAIETEKMGWVFGMRISLDRTSMLINGTSVNLSPGMSVTTEVVTGKRRIFEYVLSPITKSIEESARER